MQLFGLHSKILEDVLDGLFHIARADGVVRPAETRFLSQVARRFGFDEATFARISACYMEPDESDPYVLLGISRDASDDDIKRRYRTLVRENHPDRLVACGVPEEFVVIANDRLACINDAHDRIQKARGFT